MNHLPVPPTRLLGREQALAAAADLVRGGTRLLSFIGPAGVGKTHLALAVARRLQDDFGDGAAFVDLSDVTAAERVVSAIAEALAIREDRRETPPERLVRHLQGRHLLLLLDNFEQLLPAATDVALLLRQCPGLTFLITSRAALHVRGEQVFPVEPLELPDLSREASPEALGRSPAVALALSRIRAVQRDFAWDEPNARAVAELCVRLDGLPLAIELAAARCRYFSPQALHGRLSSGLEALDAELCDLPRRQQTLTGAIAWSYGFLSPAERHVFARLAVFAGGCNLPALAAIAGRAPDPGGASDEEALLPLVGSLIDKSLVRRSDDAEGELRLQLLQTIRQFGLQCLERSGELGAVRRLHAHYFLQWAEAAAGQWQGPDSALWLARMDRDHDNLRAALDWARDGGDAKLFARLCAALQRYWLARGHIDEGRRRLHEALHLLPPDPSPQRARLLTAAGVMAQNQCDWRIADALCALGLALSRRLNDPGGSIQALNALARSARAQAAEARAQDYYDVSLEVARKSGSAALLHRTLREAAVSAWFQGDYAAAERLAGEAHQGADAGGDDHAKALSSITLTWARLLAGGDLDAAEAAFQRARAALQSHGDHRGALRALGGLMHVVLARRDLVAARALLDEMTALTAALGDDWFIGVPLTHKAEIAFGEGRLVNTVVWIAAMEEWKIARSVQAPVHQQHRTDQMLAAAKSTLGNAAYAAAGRIGRALSPEEALREPIETEVYAAQLGLEGLAAAGSPPLLGLTHRETEVLQLVATGMSDAEVGKALFLSRRTVETHLRRIYRKLGVHSRTAAASVLGAGPQRPDA